MTHAVTAAQLVEIVAATKTWVRQLRFQQMGIADIDLRDAEIHLRDWLAAGFHGEMDSMARHGTRRSRPAGGD